MHSRYLRNERTNAIQGDLADPTMHPDILFKLWFGIFQGSVTVGHRERQEPVQFFLEMWIHFSYVVYSGNQFDTFREQCFPDNRRNSIN